MKKNLIIPALVALVVTALTIGIYDQFRAKENTPIFSTELETPVNNVLFTMDSKGNAIPLDFTTTSKKVMPAVVLINVEIGSASRGGRSQQQLQDPFQDFFQDFFPRGQQRQVPQSNQVRRGKGSGVIINSNGYIVTNNHVVEGATKIDVVMNNNRSFSAEVIGTDPSSDLALIKIDAEDLPFVTMVNSDDVEVGEWVLAIGNPLSFSSTVTAGIVSAVGRNIDILDKEQTPYAIESFIQTDAAINKGNSGGALVNLNGDLIGINSAIASPTGYYAGYGFAIPSNLVNKVVDDLLKYGEVKRAVLGVQISHVDPEFAEEKNLKTQDGVYIQSIIEGSSAEDADLKAGDVITQIDGKDVFEVPILQEKIARTRPGETVSLTINRDGKILHKDVVLKALESTTGAIASIDSDMEKMLGAKLTELTSEEKEKLNLDYGVKIEDMTQSGILYRNTKLEPGFIILKANDKEIESVDQLESILKERQNSGVMLEGIYPDNPKQRIYEAFGLN